MDRQRGVLLLVEDHDATRRTLARLLTHRGWDVRVAGTIREGLAGLAAEPDCLVLDLMLPDGGGEAVLRRVREAGLKTRVTVTTGEGDEDRLEAVRRLGPDALLRKPIALGDLCQACRSGASGDAASPVSTRGG